ncbi:MAG TPA: polymer-forming cytoskeletal protein [Gemmatimonadaceae bacterium]|nr:polymer-forming cytoskeletal protein [Gemmatimonadaceae bacterium]
MRWRNFMAIAALPLLASAVAAQRSDRDVTDLLLRVNGPVHVAVGDSAATVWVVSNDATIDGTVREQLLVVNGNGRVTGEVRGDVTVINGRLDLRPGARVGGNVLLYKSVLVRAPSAVVNGQVHDESGVSFGARAVWFFWLGMTTLVVAAGLAFAALADRQLAESATLVTDAPGTTVLAGLALMAAIPLAIFACFISIIGIPLGFATMCLVVPALMLLGYVVAGTAVGRVAIAWLTRHGERASMATERPYAPVVTGLLVLQLLAFVPVVGGLIVFVAAFVGAGSLAFRVWRRRPRRVTVSERPAILGTPA